MDIIVFPFLIGRIRTKEIVVYGGAGSGFPFLIGRIRTNIIRQIRTC